MVMSREQIAGLIQRMHNASCSWVDSRYYQKRTIPDRYNWTDTTSSIRSQSNYFGLHPNVIAVLRPAQTNHTKGVNAPGFDSTELNKAGVKAP